jgi:prophage antirepressor-like protein
MTESKSQIQNSSQIIFSKQFENSSIKFIKRKNRVWITSSAIARGLEIDRANINQIYHNNKDLLTPYTCVMKIIMKGQKRNVRVFDKTGFIGICMRSNSDKAVPFQKWVLKIVDQIEEKGYYIDKKSNPIDIIIQQSEILKKTGIFLKQQQERINKIDNELKSFEQRYEDERPITTKTIKKIQDFVHLAHEKTGKHWGKFYKKIWNKFNISSTKDCSEKTGQEIVKWLNENKTSFIYGDQYKKLSGGIT